MKGGVGFRQRQEFMKPSHIFIPAGSVLDPDPCGIGSGFNQVSAFESGSVFGIRIRIQEGKTDPKK
jgi:hypothetical protein